MRYQTVPSSRAALAYLDLGRSRGNGDPARLYLGGLGSASTVAFAPVVAHPALAGRGRDLLVDLIGSGWSDHDDGFSHTIDAHAATLVTLLEEQKVGPVAVVGHSLGGSVAISLAAQRPDLVSHLVVAEPNLDPGVGTFSAEISAHDEDSFAGHGYRRMVEALRAEGDRGDVTSAQFARTMLHWSPRGLHRTAVSLLASRPATFREQLAVWAGPRRYISGADSHEDLRAVQASGVEVLVVPDAAHVLMCDNLDGFAEALVDLPT